MSGYISLGASTPTTGTLLQSLLHTYDKELGLGAFNRARFSDPEFDTALEAILQEFDAEKRIAGLEEVTRMVFAKTPVVPLYWQKVHGASKDGIIVHGGLAEDTLPQAMEKAE